MLYPYWKKDIDEGRITDEERGRVLMRTQIGTQTILPEPGNELLPRIC